MVYFKHILLIALISFEGKFEVYSFIWVIRIFDFHFSTPLTYQKRPWCVFCHHTIAIPPDSDTRGKRPGNGINASKSCGYFFRKGCINE